MTLRTKLAGLVLPPLSAVIFAAQATAASAGALTIAVENDAFTKSDNNYTNGVGVTWVSDDLERYAADRFVGKWGEFWGFLPFVNDTGYRTYASWTLGQEIHTPHDIEIPDPPAGDQPYAGILYVDSVLYARSHRSAYAWELKLGVVGPASQAENVQKDFHALIGSVEPMGWDTQLPDEPVINMGLTAAHLWREGAVGDSARWRLVPVGHAGLGTYHRCRTGMYGEIGWNLVDALGTTALREGLRVVRQGRSVNGGPSPSPGWAVMRSYYLHSTATCSRTAVGGTRPCRQRIDRRVGASRYFGVEPRDDLLNQRVRYAGEERRVRHPELLLEPAVSAKARGIHVYGTMNGP
jgi:hypothetical protein